MNVLQYSPGQKITIFLETLNVSGSREDGYAPSVERIILPDFSLSSSAPSLMDRVDIGLYCFSWTLPTGADAVGSYLIDILYNVPGTEHYLTDLWQIVVTAPYGNYGVTSF